MKHIFIISLILLFNTSGWAQESNQDSNQKIKDLEIKVLNLENHQKLFDATIEVNRKKVEIDFDSKLSEIKKENSVVEFIGSIIVLIGAIAFFTIIYQIFWGFKKIIDKKTIELQGEFNIEFNKLANDMNNKFNIEFNQLADTNKMALSKAISVRGIEIELLQDYPIIIVEDTLNKEAITLKDLILSYEFRSVAISSIKSLVNVDLSEKHVLIFFKSPEEEFLKALIEEYPKIGILGYGRNYKFFPEPMCLGFSNSYSTIYNNLMSLLHYKRYLNSQA